MQHAVPLQVPSSTDSKAATKAVLEQIICRVCFKKGHRTARCWKRYNEKFQVPDLQTALSAMLMTACNFQDWIPDSGATPHVW